MFAVFLVLASFLVGQEKKKETLGFELDVFAYATGGYYGSVWYGVDNLRFRGVIAKVGVPDFFIDDKFENNEVNAYAFIVDYFFKPNYEGWWI